MYNIIMKKFLTLFFILLLPSFVNAEIFNIGITIEDVPKALYGSWRVNAKLDKTNSPKTFKPQSLDFWSLSRNDNVIKLDNPQSGANAEISVKTVENNVIVFSKRTSYDNKVLLDTVRIRLEENKFSGINIIELNSYSLIDNHLLKTETATYLIEGEKYAGDSIIK